MNICKNKFKKKDYITKNVYYINKIKQDKSLRLLPFGCLQINLCI